LPGHPGSGPAPVSEDDETFLLFFDRLFEKLIEAARRFNEVVNADSCELLGLAGTRIFTNLQLLYDDLNLLDVLCKVSNAPASSPSISEAAALASLVCEAVMHLRVIYKRPGTEANPAPMPVDSDEESDGSSDNEGSDLDEPDGGEVVIPGVHGPCASLASSIDFDTIEDSEEEAL
jgi:hypothetical protein